MDREKRHPDLWALCRRSGSVAKAARAAEIHLWTFHMWVRLKSFPRYVGNRRLNEIETNLLTLTGKTLDQLWPLELRRAIDAELLARDSYALRSPLVHELLAKAEKRLTVEAPDRVLERREAVAELHRVLDRYGGTCRARPVKVLRMRFGLDDGVPRTLDEVGRVFGVTRERVRQEETKAIRQLQEHMDRDRVLKQQLESVFRALTRDS